MKRIFKALFLLCLFSLSLMLITGCDEKTANISEVNGKSVEEIYEQAKNLMKNTTDYVIEGEIVETITGNG